MDIQYENILDGILRAKRDADCENKVIHRIIVSKEEWLELISCLNHIGTFVPRGKYCPRKGEGHIKLYGIDIYYRGDEPKEQEK